MTTDRLKLIQPLSLPGLLALLTTRIEQSAYLRSGFIDRALLFLIQKTTGIMKGQGEERQGIPAAVGIPHSFQCNSWLNDRIFIGHVNRKHSATGPAAITLKYRLAV